jgi:hypothetical protein
MPGMGAIIDAKSSRASCLIASILDSSHTAVAVPLALTANPWPKQAVVPRGRGRQRWWAEPLDD